MIRLIMVLVACLALLGCPNGWPGCLNDRCPEGRYRDSFCGCSEKASPSAPPPTAQPKALAPDCVCGQEDGSLIAWFKFLPKPSRYVDQKVKISAGKCESLTVCPLIGDGWRIVANRSFWLDVKVAHTRTNLLNDFTIYGLQGSETGMPVEAAIRPRALVRLASLRGASIALSNAEANAEPGAYCRQHCDAKDALCLRRKFPGDEGTEIYKVVHDAIVNRSPLIDVNALKRAADQSSDPCNRGNVVFADGKATNSGGECLMTIPVTESGSKLVVLLPGYLEGSFSIQGERLDVSFTDVSTTPGLQFESAGLNEEYGGDLSWLSIEKGRVLGETTNGCVELSF